MKTKYINLVILFILLSFNFAFSQRDSSLIFERNRFTYEDLNVIQTDEIEIVSASRTAKKVEDLPVSVYVVTREEIQLNGYVTLVDVLKSIPGFMVSQPGSGADGETFLMRGFQGNFYTKILVNNIPITPSVTGSLPIGSQLPVRQAERIEIIFGPASAVYGADATSGVINIITKDPESFNFAQADLVGGTGGYTYMNFSVGGKAGKNNNIFQYSIYGSRQDFENMNIKHTESDVYFPMHYYNLMSDSVSNFLLEPLGLQYANEMSDNQLFLMGLNEITAVDTLYQQGYSGSFYNPDFGQISQQSELIGIRFKFKSLTFGYNYMSRRDHSSIGTTPFLYKFDDRNNFIGNYSHIFSIQHSIPFGKFISSTNLSYLNYRLDNYSTFGINYLYGMDINDVYIYQASDDINFEQLMTFTPNPKVELVGGFSYQYSGNLPSTNYLFKPFDESLYSPFSTSVNYNDTLFGDFGINPLVFSNTGLFLQSYFTFKIMTIIISGRWDDNSVYGISKNPRSALLFKLGKKMVLRTSLGYSYKAPSSDKEFYSIGTPAGPNLNKIVYSFIESDLKPEKFRSFEFGIRYKIGENSFFDFSNYTCEISNVIKTVPVFLDSIELNNMYENNGYTIVRKYMNIENMRTFLNGTQLSLYFNDVISAINLDIEFYHNSNLGFEKIVSAEYFAKYDAGENPDINQYLTDSVPLRMLPSNLNQINVSFSPFKNMYVNIENVWMSNYLKSYIPVWYSRDEQYFVTKGHYNLDIMLNYKIGRNFYTYLKVTNVLNSEYGGIDATRTDIDLPYNPQLLRNIRFGINYRLE